MKTKRRIRGGKPFELISDLHFEECLFRLEHDAGHLVIDLQQQAEDQARFLITLKGKAGKSANITGTLQPWGEATTRVEGILFSRPSPDAARISGILSWITHHARIARFALLIPVALAYAVWLFAGGGIVIPILLCGALSLLIVLAVFFMEWDAAIQGVI